MKNPEPFIVSIQSTIREIIKTINNGKSGIAMLIDQHRRLIATITDGDIRRAFLKGADLDTTAEYFLEARPEKYQKPTVIHHGASPSEALELMREKVIRHLPVIDKNREVVGLITEADLVPQMTPSVQAVIMAGGHGTRLKPLTENTPKPMLPVGDKPLLERIIKQLRECGIQSVNITTHYKPEKISEHFGDGGNFGVNINYVSEKKPLGTAGAVGLIKKSDQPIIVINGDILTNVDFHAMMAFHAEHRADLTVGVRKFDFEVPYGVVDADGVMVRAIREKPTYRFFVNAGIYLLNPEVQQLISGESRLDMTDLIQNLMDSGKTVTSFPVIEYWLDIGNLQDYQRAQEDINNGKVSN